MYKLAQKSAVQLPWIQWINRSCIAWKFHEETISRARGQFRVPLDIFVVSWTRRKVDEREAREFRCSESSSSFSACLRRPITWPGRFLFRRGPHRHTWPPCRPSRFWQRPAKMRATTRNAWDSVWSPSHSPCQLFRPQRWVKLERKELHDRGGF